MSPTRKKQAVRSGMEMLFNDSLVTVQSIFLNTCTTHTRLIKENEIWTGSLIFGQSPCICLSGWNPGSKKWTNGAFKLHGQIAPHPYGRFIDWIFRQDPGYPLPLFNQI